MDAHTDLLTEIFEQFFSFRLLAWSFISFLIIIFAGWLQNKFKADTSPAEEIVDFSASAKKDPSKVFYTVEEVAKHTTRDDIWLIIDDKVYDVSSYVDAHHGGDAILNYPGMDNTKPFYGDQHGDSVFDLVQDYWIGMVKKEKSQPSSSNVSK